MMHYHHHRRVDLDTEEEEALLGGGGGDGDGDGDGDEVKSQRSEYAAVNEVNWAVGLRHSFGCVSNHVA